MYFIKRAHITHKKDNKFLEKTLKSWKNHGKIMEFCWSAAVGTLSCQYVCLLHQQTKLGSIRLTWNSPQICGWWAANQADPTVPTRNFHHKHFRWFSLFWVGANLTWNLQSNRIEYIHGLLRGKGRGKLPWVGACSNDPKLTTNLWLVCSQSNRSDHPNLKFSVQTVVQTVETHFWWFSLFRVVANSTRNLANRIRP